MGATKIVTEHTVANKIAIYDYENRGHHIGYDAIQKIIACDNIISTSLIVTKSALIASHNKAYNRLIMINGISYYCHESVNNYT